MGMTSDTAVRRVAASGSRSGRVRLLVALLAACVAMVSAGCATDSTASNGASSAPASSDCGPGCEGKLEPRYQPREPKPEGAYDNSYLFGMTRGVADSTMHPAVKVPFFVLTIPLDIVTFPFALIGGFF